MELSGVGSPSILQKAGIDVIVDNPSVGENLNDHSATGLSVQVKDEYPTAELLLRNPEIAQQAMEAYIKHKAGPFTNAPTTCGFVSLALADANLTNAEEHVQSLVAEYQKAYPNGDPANRDPLLARQLLDPNEAISQIVFLGVGADIEKCDTPSRIFQVKSPGNWVTLAACSTRSLSRGSIHIDSSDPTRHPVIDPAYYSHPLDLDVVARTILHCIQLARTEPLNSVLQKDGNGDMILLPTWTKGLPKTIDEAKDFAAANTVTEYHPIGTCAMLPKEKGGVVSSSLKVYGTSNVRVVDASIFPTHV